jgi:hypothetical protein
MEKRRGPPMDLKGRSCKQENRFSFLFFVNVFSFFYGRINIEYGRLVVSSCLPASVVAHRSRVGTTTTTAAAATTVVATMATATTTSPSAATATATAVASHFVQTRIDLLLGLGKNGEKITSLLRI